MDDTPLDVYRLQVSTWQRMSFTERLRAGCRADALGLKGAADLVQSRDDDPAALFIARHGSIFPDEQRERVAEAIRARRA